MRLLPRLLVPAALALRLLTVASAAELPRLLLPVESVEPTATISGPARIPARSRPFRLNPDLTGHRPVWLRPGVQVRLDLVQDQDVTLEVVQVATAADGALEISGRAEGDPESSVTLVVHGDQLSGFAHLSGLGRFEWLPTAAGGVELTRVSGSPTWFCATPALPTGSPKFDGSEPGRLVRSAVTDGIWDPSTEPEFVDILVAYSAAAATAEGSEESLRRRIRLTVEAANEIYANSRVGVRLNPVYIGVTPWTESGSLPTDWDQLRAAGSAIRTLRNDYKADLAFLVIEADKFGISGVAQIPGPEGDAESFLSLIRRTGMIGEPKIESVAHGVTFPHEAGHLFGAGHDHAAPADSGLGGAFAYSAGHRFEAGHITHTTVMSYPPGTPLAYISNPALFYDGEALGVAVGGAALPADNAQTMNRLAPKVARYRTARSRVGFAEPRTSVGEADGTLAIRLERSGDLNTSTRVRVGVARSGTASAGTDFGPLDAAFVTFDTNQATAEVTLPMLQDDLAEGDETIELTLSGVLGDHGLNGNASTRITIEDDEPATRFSLSDLQLPETGESRDLNVEFTGTLGVGETREMELRIGTGADAAGEGADFEVTPRHYVFTETRRTATLRIRALPDGVAESDESFQLILGNAVLPVQILDDDRPGAPLPVAAPDNAVGALLVLADGSVLVGGDFQKLGNTTNSLVHLESTGVPRVESRVPSLQSSTVPHPGIFPAKINCLVRDSVGGVLVGGFIGTADERPAHSLIRLQSDGSRDPSFLAARFDSGVFAVVEQVDGRLLVGGDFTRADGQPAPGLAQLNRDGSLRGEYADLARSVGRIEAFARLPDGRILAGGFLEKFQGRSVSRLVRLQPDGALDESFPLLTSGASGRVKSIAALPDGRAYVGGLFDLLGGRPYRRLGRLLGDGSVDLAFKAPQPNGEINCIQPLPNGQVMVGGAFTRIGNLPRRFVALLNEDGAVDTSFDLGTGAGDHVWTLAVSGDGALYVGGAFGSFNGHPAQGLAKLRLPEIVGSLGTPSWTTDTRLSFRVYGLPGARYALESSEELRVWNPAGDIQITDPDQIAVFEVRPGSETQFYRLMPAAR